MEVLKVGVLDIGSKPFTSQGEAGGGEFSSNCASSCRGGVYSKTVSQPLLPVSVWVFSCSYDM